MVWILHWPRLGLLPSCSPPTRSWLAQWKVLARSSCLPGYTANTYDILQHCIGKRKKDNKRSRDQMQKKMARCCDLGTLGNAPSRANRDDQWSWRSRLDPTSNCGFHWHMYHHTFGWEFFVPPLLWAEWPVSILVRVAQPGGWGSKSGDRLASDITVSFHLLISHQSLLSFLFFIFIIFIVLTHPLPPSTP